MQLHVRLSILFLMTVILSASSQAAPLLGSTVTGSFSFNGTNEFSPSTAVIVDPGYEFRYTSQYNQITADFNASSLTLTDVSFSPGTNYPQTFVFTDSAFVGLILTPTSNSYPTVFTSSLSGNTLTINLPLEPLDTATYMASFNLTPAGVTPEPSSLALLLTGMLGVAGAVRRRST